MFFNLFISIFFFFAPPVSVVQWIDPQEHDFGDLRQSSTVSVTFSFKNTTETPIVLQTVRTTCGCTAAEWTQAPIAPGEKGVVKIEYDADKSGAFRKKIRVFFDQQRKPEILWIQGNVE
jgi:Protein of unknown function (DUF1573)